MYEFSPVQNLSVTVTASAASEKCTAASNDNSSVLEGNFDPERKKINISMIINNHKKVDIISSRHEIKNKHNGRQL